MSGEPCGNYLCADDVSNWLSGTDDDAKLAIIEKMEALIERVTRTHFWPKAFDVKLNGNDKNRLFLGCLSADIITVSLVSVWDVEMDASWYTWDSVSIHIDLTGVAMTNVELRYRLNRIDARGIFPYGYNNVRVVGIYGKAAVPSWVKQVARILVEDHNDPTLYAHATLQSETIGNYAYSLGSGGIAEYPTGVIEADKWLRQFRRGKAIFMAP